MRKRRNNVVLLIILVQLLFSCSNTMNHNEIISEEISPNGRYKIVMFYRSINATTEQSLQVSVLKEKKTLKDTAGNVLVIEGNASAKWIDDKNILIVIEKNSKIYQKKDTIGDISVIYNIDE